MFACALCGNSFTRVSSLRQHERQSCRKRSDYVEPTRKRKKHIHDSYDSSEENMVSEDRNQMKITSFFKAQQAALSDKTITDPEIIECSHRKRMKTPFPTTSQNEKRKEGTEEQILFKRLLLPETKSDMLGTINKRLEELEKEKKDEREALELRDQYPTCPHCVKTFTRVDNLTRHIKKYCPKLKDVFTPVPNLQPTREATYNGNVYPHHGLFHCYQCDKDFTRKQNLQKHLQTACRNKPQLKNLAKPELRRGQRNPLLEGDVFRTESAFNKYLTNYQVMNKEKESNIQEFLEKKRATVKRIITRDLEEKKCLKFSIDMESILQAPDGEVTDWAIKNSNLVCIAATDIDDVITQQYDKILHRIEEEMLRGSGWRIVELLNLMVRTSKYEPLKGGSYIQLPTVIANRGSVINPQNHYDNKCFKYAILSSLHKSNNPERISNLLRYEDQFNWEDLTYPVSVQDVKIFERNNSDVSISIYAVDEENTIIPQKVDLPKARHFDLLLLTEETEEEPFEKQHYTYIKNFERLVSSQISKHNGKKYICKRCITHHSSAQLLADHLIMCSEKPLARVVMPKSTACEYDVKTKLLKELPPTLKFNQPQNSCTVPVRIFADSEALLIKSQDVSHDPTKSSSTIKQHHVPMSFGYVVVSDLPDDVMKGIPLKTQIIREVINPTKTFLEDLVDISKKLKVLYARKEVMTELTAEEKQKYKEANICYMCDKEFKVESDKARDHCHITGRYRGAAHKNCKVNAQNPTFLPIYLHNNSQYDSHFIIRQLGNIDAEIKVIPNTSENLITFSIIPKDGIEIRFLDSFRFMASSLDNLAANLTSEMYVHVEKNFESKHMHLLRRKGVFCYDYIDSLEKLKETKLPSRKDFYNTLNDCETNKKDYIHAWKVFKAFKCKDLGEYSDLYLKLDVLLLADVFEAFRQVCLEAYRLNPCWYYTAPSLAWNAALRKTGVELELIQDEEMLFMIEKGIRGGVAQCIKRYAKAKNKYINKADSKYKKFIAYLDANNLYGWAMSQLLPVRDFHWDTSGKIKTKEDILSLPTDHKNGYILEVDVRYPEQYHDKHRDLPFLPETRVPPEGKHKKLLTTLYDKEKYVVHYRLLQQALKHGLEITKVHRVIAFHQENWLKKYIDLNTDKRKEAKNDFEKDFFKLMNNAVFGKTMENVRNRINLEIVNNVKRLRKLIRNPFFKRRIIYDENLCAVLCQRKTVVMDKPIYVGMSILDLSKMLMYEFHYENMLPRYGAALSLCYMDTDSFVYYISGIDFYAEMKKHAQDFDTSDYPTDNELYSLSNKKVLGKFKDEANSVPVECFVGLKAKMYAMKYGGKVVKRAKGVKKHALKNKISYNDYVSCLKESSVNRVSFRMIQKKDHIVFTKEVTKISLSSNDDKRFILPNLVDTLPHGHFMIPFIVEDMVENADTVKNTDHIVLEKENAIVISQVSAQVVLV